MDNVRAAPPSWPEIRERDVTVRFDTAAHKQYVLTIYGRNGSPLYVLDARIPWDEAHEGDYDFSGAFDCRFYSLNRVSDNGYPSLLQNVRNATADWQTDGRFLYKELAGLAGAGDSRAIIQQSRMRGMNMEILIRKIVIDEKMKLISSFEVHFSFKNDPTATSDIAAKQ